MTLKFIDGFNHYSTAQLTRKYQTVNGSPVIQTTGSRWGTGCLEMQNGNQAVVRTIPAGASWVIGCAIKIASFAQTYKLISLRDTGNVQVDLDVNTDGTLELRSNGTSVTNGKYTTAISLSTWYHLQLKVTISNSISASSCIVKLNNTTIITVATGANLRQGSSNSSANELMLGNQGAGSGMTVDYCDLYVCDQSGSVNNDFLGDMRVETLYPNGDGSHSAFVGSDGNSTNNSLLVDENPANDDTDYVESSSAGDIDSYAYGDLSSTPVSIAGIQSSILARKTDAGTRTLAAVYRTGGTDAVGSTISLASSYAYQYEIQETNPNTSAAWTASDVNGAEFGIKLIA